MNPTIKRLILWGAFAVLLGFLLSGCGQSTTEEAGGTEGAEATEEATAESEGAGEAEEVQETGDAGDFPNQALQMIVTYTAGAATDTEARIMTQHAEEALGQSIAIINVEGAGGTSGWNQFAAAEPDGYTLTAYNLPHVLSKPLVEDTEYDHDTFIPIVNWGENPVVFAVLPDSPYETLDDLVEAAEENPESITVGNAGLYVGQHLGVLMFEDAAGVKLQNVPHDGAAAAQTSLLGGQIDVNAGNLSDMYRLGDEVRILAVASEERHPYLPDVPTFKELGYDDVVMSTIRGVAVPEGTPSEIVEQLEEGLLEILNRDDYQEELEGAGVTPLILSGEELDEFYNEQAETVETLLRDLGYVD